MQLPEDLNPALTKLGLAAILSAAKLGFRFVAGERKLDTCFVPEKMICYVSLFPSIDGYESDIGPDLLHRIGLSHEFLKT